MLTTTQIQYDFVPANGPEFELSITQVPDEQHIHFRPRYSGTTPQWIALKLRIFTWVDRFCDEYCGGIWSFCMLNNGGAFMAPDTDGDDKRHLLNDINGNGAEMSTEATGTAVCLIEYSHHVYSIECDIMTEHYYHLRDYALQYSEPSAIMCIID